MLDLTENLEFSKDSASLILNILSKKDAELAIIKKKCLSWVLQAYYEKFHSDKVEFNIDAFDCPYAIWLSDEGIKEGLIEYIYFDSTTFKVLHIGIVSYDENRWKYGVSLTDIYNPCYEDIMQMIVEKIEEEIY